jgi:hypothetical protein
MRRACKSSFCLQATTDRGEKNIFFLALWKTAIYSIQYLLSSDLGFYLMLDPPKGKFVVRAQRRTPRPSIVTFPIFGLWPRGRCYNHNLSAKILAFS